MDGVSIVNCPDYDPKNVLQGVDKAIALAGLSEGEVKGKTIILKPNCLMAAPPERHITTHPTIVSALCEWFFENGAKKVQIGESSGVGGQGRTTTALKECGLAGVARSTGAELLDFDKCKVRTFDISGMKIGIAQPALEADLRVSVPKLKTHPSRSSRALSRTSSAASPVM